MCVVEKDALNLSIMILGAVICAASVNVGMIIAGRIITGFASCECEITFRSRTCKDKCADFSLTSPVMLLISSVSDKI